MPLEGDIATLPVRELFDMLARTRASGRLSLSSGMIARRFHFCEGRVLLASSTEETMLLGRLLVARGLVDEDQLRGVLATRAGEARLGKAIADAGLVSPAALARVLVEKIERLLIDSLTWARGRFYFDEEVVPARPAAASASVDLAFLLDRTFGGPGGAVPVADADVLETRPLSPRAQAAANAIAPAPRVPAAREPTRRRKRRAVA